MSRPVEAWIDQAIAGRGVLACGVRRADRSFAVKSGRVDFPEPQVEQVLRKLYEAVYALQQNHIATERVRWAFENAQLHCVARPGGVMAALLVNPEVAPPAEIERLLSAFGPTDTRTGPPLAPRFLQGTFPVGRPGFSPGETEARARVSS
jgi:hypothetical protein